MEFPNIELFNSDYEQKDKSRHQGIVAAETAFARLFESHQSDPYRDSSAEIASSYWGDLNNRQSVIDATRMFQVARLLENEETAQDAKKVLGYYLEYTEDPHVAETTVAILGEISVIEEHNRRRYQAWRERTADALVVNSIAIDEAGHNWNLHPLAGVQAEDIEAVSEELSGLSAETLFTMTANAIATLEDPSESDEERYYARYLSETIYGPISEGLSLNRFAARAQEASMALELEKTGNRPMLKEAQLMLDKMGSPKEVAYHVMRLISQLTDYSILSNAVGNRDFYHELSVDGLSDIESQVTTVSIDGFSSSGKIPAAAEARVKGVAGVAKKLVATASHHGGLLPEQHALSDLVGIRFTVESTADVKKAYESLIYQLSSVGNAIWSHAPSRPGYSLHAKGSPEFVDGMKSVADAANLDIETKENDGGYEYAKATVALKYIDQEGIDREIPVEIQIMNRQTKRSGEIGEYAHLLHKFEKYSGQKLPIDLAHKISYQLSRAQAKRDYLIKTPRADEEHNTLDPRTRQLGQKLIAECQETVHGNEQSRLRQVAQTALQETITVAHVPTGY